MDFTVSVGAPAPVPVRINGAEYKVPRFLLPAFKEWAALRSRDQLDAALAQYSDEQERARFRLFWTAPPQDVAALADELRSPEGVEYVLRHCLDKAGVPAEVLDALLNNADPVQLRLLSDQLASVRDAVAQMTAGEAEGEPNPTTSPQPA